VPTAPAFQRLDVDERRRLLLEHGERLFTSHTYAELSMAAIAREAGISKALLYHYFPSKQEFFRATLGQAFEELRRRTEPAAGVAPAEALYGSLGVFLSWIEEHHAAYEKLMRTSQETPEVRELVDEVRSHTTQRILDGITPPGGSASPAARTAVHAWLWFMDGACLHWIEHRDLERDELRGLLLGTLLGALTAAGAAPGGVVPGEAAPPD